MQLLGILRNDMIIPSKPKSGQWELSLPERPAIEDRTNIRAIGSSKVYTRMYGRKDGSPLYVLLCRPFRRVLRSCQSSIFNGQLPASFKGLQVGHSSETIRTLLMYYTLSDG